MKVILYKTDTCPQCRVLKIKLEKKGIPFEEVKDMDIMNERGIQSIPTLQVDDKLMGMGEANKWINAWKVKE